MIPALTHSGIGLVLLLKCKLKQPLYLDVIGLPVALMLGLHPPFTTQSPTFHNTVEEHYLVLYFEALDLIIACITGCFDQPGYKTYSKVEALLIKAAETQPREEELQFVHSFYGSDFDSLLLKTHQEIF